MHYSVYACFKECEFGVFAVTGESFPGRGAAVNCSDAPAGVVGEAGVAESGPESFEIPVWRNGQPDGVLPAGLYERVGRLWLEKVKSIVDKSIDAPRDAEKLHRVICWYSAVCETVRTGREPSWWLERKWR